MGAALGNVGHSCGNVLHQLLCDILLPSFVLAVDWHAAYMWMQQQPSYHVLQDYSDGAADLRVICLLCCCTCIDRAGNIKQYPMSAEDCILR
jgi:hypothetical protein